jgi:hypothetical protein
MLRVLLAALAAFFVLGTHAFAQTVMAADPNLVRDFIAPTAVTVASGVIAVGLSLIAGFIGKRTGMTVSQGHLNSLHSALASAVGKMIMANAGKLDLSTLKTNNALLNIGLNYVKWSVPDAIRNKKLTDDKVIEMILNTAPKVVSDTARLAPVSGTMPDPVFPAAPRPSTDYSTKPRVGGKD